MRKILASCVIGIAAMLTTAPAQAAQILCANTDISPTAINCSGFVAGNALGGSTEKLGTAAAALAKLGFTGNLAGIETIEKLSGATLIDFNKILVGRTIIGVHYGNGQGSPGFFSGKGDGNDTAFYLFDAGAGLDKFSLKYAASSSVRLYQTGVSAVPEPGTWAMMLFGFGGMGMVLRRRRRNFLTVAQFAA